MKKMTLKQIHAEARKYGPDSEPLQDAFVAGVRWVLTGKYYKPAELFGKSEDNAPSFEEWWTLYAKKRGRKKAEAKWNRLTPKERQACMDATPSYVASTPDLTYRKDPLTYLNGECWNDEIIQKSNYEQQQSQRLAAKAARILGAN